MVIEPHAKNVTQPVEDVQVLTQTNVLIALM